MRWQTWNHQAKSKGMKPPRLVMRSQTPEGLQLCNKKPGSTSSLPRLPRVSQSASSSRSGISTSSKSQTKSQWQNGSDTPEDSFATQEWSHGTLSDLQEMRRSTSSSRKSLIGSLLSSTHSLEPANNVSKSEVESTGETHCVGDQSDSQRRGKIILPGLKKPEEDEHNGGNAVECKDETYSEEAVASEDCAVSHIWVDAFKMLANNGLLPIERVHAALQLLGHGSMNVENVDVSLKDQGKGSSKGFLTLKEFCAFIERYEQMHEEQEKKPPPMD